MNRLLHLITKSSDRCYEYIFFFLVFFCREKLHYNWDTSDETSSWITSVCSIVCWCLFVCWWYIATSSWSSTSRMLVRFLMTHFFQPHLLHCFPWSTNQILLLNIFSFLFLQNFLLINSISPCFHPWIFCHPLASLFPSFSPFLVLFRTFCIMVTVNKPYHVPYVSPTTTWGTIFTEIFFGVSREWVRPWSLVASIKTFVKKLLAVRPKN